MYSSNNEIYVEFEDQHFSINPFSSPQSYCTSLRIAELKFAETIDEQNTAAASNESFDIEDGETTTFFPILSSETNNSLKFSSNELQYSEKNGAGIAGHVSHNKSTPLLPGATPFQKRFLVILIFIAPVLGELWAFFLGKVNTEVSLVAVVILGILAMFVLVARKLKLRVFCSTDGLALYFFAGCMSIISASLGYLFLRSATLITNADHIFQVDPFQTPKSTGEKVTFYHFQSGSIVRSRMGGSTDYGAASHFFVSPVITNTSTGTEELIFWAVSFSEIPSCSSECIGVTVENLPIFNNYFWRGMNKKNLCSKDLKVENSWCSSPNQIFVELTNTLHKDIVGLSQIQIATTGQYIKELQWISYSIFFCGLFMAEIFPLLILLFWALFGIRALLNDLLNRLHAVMHQFTSMKQSLH